MITLRPAAARGRTEMGWLDSRHTFSFGDYFDSAHMGFRALRVINDDRVQPGEGFGAHPHRDMEIISYVVEGELEHKDSMGTGSVVSPGEIQRMSAGSGVLHSEFNPSARDSVRFLQIWIVPETKGIPPSYEQKRFPEEERRGVLRLVASRGGRDGSVSIHQDADVYASLLERGERVSMPVRPGRHVWVQVARGEITLEGRRMEEGDGAAVSDERELRIEGAGPAEILVFDLA